MCKCNIKKAVKMALKSLKKRGKNRKFKDFQECPVGLGGYVGNDVKRREEKREAQVSELLGAKPAYCGGNYRKIDLQGRKGFVL